MIRKAASILALSLLILPACGDDDDNDNNVVEEIPTNYLGLYKTDCIANSVLDLSHTIRTVDSLMAASAVAKNISRMIAASRVRFRCAWKAQSKKKATCLKTPSLTC
jgi:hypothetical protein